jgi:integrase
VFQIRWRVNGGPARYETIGPDRKEAEQALALKLAEINRGTYRERVDATFLEFASSWFANHQGQLKPSTVVDYRLTLERHLLPFFGEYLLGQIGVQLIERYVAEKVAERQEGDRRVARLEAELAERSEAGMPVRATKRRLYEAKQDRGLCHRSINKTLTRLEQVMSVAEAHGYIDRNPVGHVKRLKPRKRARPYLQLDQVDPLIEATPEQYRALVETLLLAGLRIGELCALRWRDVDLLGDPPRMTISRSVYRRQEGPVKTGEEGTVTFGRRLLRTLLDHKESSPFGGDDDLVFCTAKGGYLNESNIRRRILAPAIARANERLRLEDRPPIPPVTPHGLRYTFCSLLISQGEDVATVAAQMRHADPTTTLRVYTQVMKHTRQGVGERLDDALWGANGDSGRKVVANRDLGASEKNPGEAEIPATMRIART